MVVKMWCMMKAWFSATPFRKDLGRATCGADGTYASDLRKLARTDGYLNEEESIDALANARRDLYDQSVLDGVERMLHQGLDTMWKRVCEQMRLDPMDQELIALSVNVIGGRQLEFVNT
jgi:hypothetical protein